MRVARLYDLDDVRIEEQPIPELGPGDALVKMAVCGICTSDTFPWYVRRKAPAVLGHEPAGRIVQLGTDAEGYAVGDRVFIHHHAPCMTCRRCRQQEYSMCKAWRESSIDPGGLAEYVRVPGHNLRNDCFVIPDDLSMEDAALIEPVACAVQALKRKSPVQKGDHVLVVGAGMMGQILMLVARHHGAGNVIAADRVPYRLKKALELGAQKAIDVSTVGLADGVADATNGDMADLIVVCPGSIAAMEDALTATAPGATVCLFTPSAEDEQLPISPHDFWFNHITLTASYSCGPPDTADAMDLIRSGAVTADLIVTDRFPLDRAGEGFATVSAAQDTIKTLVIIDPEEAAS
ncbi:TPA: sorbitol dehydrogenase [Candidatus Latescibacteria bacterium]|nr:sorbitol dehydrogenase [Candidatus Latescibacterota bacterium]